MGVTHAGILAAGEGARLRAAGIATPKPLVPVAGVPLIERTLAAIAAAGIGEVACIVNEASGAAVEAHCRRRPHGLALRFVHRTTPSSMESLFALAPMLAASDPFLLLTVDAVFAPGVLPDFLASAGGLADAAAVLAVTDFVDDEKPLRLTVSPTGRVTALGPPAAASPLVTAGFYVLHPRIFAESSAARRAGCTALRQFLGHLLARGFPVYGVRVGMTVDVDRPEDLAAAAALVGAHP